MGPRAKSPHQGRIELFMANVGQAVPAKPQVPSQDIRVLRAKLILEETLELLDALGMQVDLKVNDETEGDFTHVGRWLRVRPRPLANNLDLAHIAKEIADVSAVAISTASACGIADEGLLQAVDINNILKTATDPLPTHSSTVKFIKPPNHKQPDIATILAQQTSYSSAD
jgi:predicted HAD superfamily Cof-like phosphohydrolase